MTDKLTSKSSSVVKTTREGVDAFLQAVKETPPAAVQEGRGRLIFALDATASRQRTWDRAMALQNDMFINTRGIGELDVQLVYYRGYDECRASAFKQIATLSGGAHCQFDESSARALGDLLNAVAAYAAGGRKALLALKDKGSRQAVTLLEQIDG